MTVISKLLRRRLPALAGLAALATVPTAAGVAQASAGRAAHVPYAQLASVSCPGVNDCVAVGWHTVGANALTLYPLAEAWNGRSWRLLPAPVIPGRLVGISCPRPAACIAVGTHDSSAGSDVSPLAATWNGSSWRLVTTPHTPSNFHVSNLGSISCTGPGSCIAVTSNGAAEPTTDAAVEAWDGTSWRLLTIFGQSSLNGVACKTAARCLAVGSTSPASDSQVPFAAAPKGGTWQAVATPPGDNGNLSSNLASTSCATTTLCMAVGLGTGGMLIDEWTGSAWNQLTAPVAGALNGVRCRTATTCVAVGGNGQNAVAVAWNGTAWRALAPVEPVAPSTFGAVACAAVDSCMAVGFSGTPSTRNTLAERWDGTRWVMLKTPAA